MQELLKTIFEHNGFRQSGERASAFFYEKTEEEKKEYYLLDFAGPEVLDNYLETGNFEEVFALFEEKKALTSDIEKNTSLIICIKLNNIKNEINGIRNKILLIEEDDFWFKKYIILYTDAAIPVIADGAKPADYFNTQLQNGETFRQYKEDIYLNENYFLTIQLFLKLPFLSIPLNSSGDFRSVDDLLIQTLSASEFQFALTLRSVTALADTDWTALQKASTLTESHQLIDDFFNKFYNNA